MVEHVDSDSIEAIMGAKRLPTQHLVRAVSADRTVYIMHSAICLETTRGDLLSCLFSSALGNGINLDEWVEDVTTVGKVVQENGWWKLVQVDPIVVGSLA